MDAYEFSKTRTLERYSFLWSEARLVIAAIALFLGGVPVLRVILPIPGLYGFVGLILTLSWIISGVVSGYLLYRWMKSNKTLFGGKNQRDAVAFFVNIISGFNLGITGLFGRNIGMTISSNRVIFGAVAILYLLVAVYLFRRWKESGRRIFFSADTIQNL